MRPRLGGRGVALGRQKGLGSKWPGNLDGGWGQTPFHIGCMSQRPFWIPPAHKKGRQGARAPES